MGSLPPATNKAKIKNFIVTVTNSQGGIGPPYIPGRLINTFVAQLYPHTETFSGKRYSGDKLP